MAKTKIERAALVPAEERISLYFKDARSDKEYHLQLVAEGAGWMVHYQNGPRGGTLSHGKKTTSPVDFETAKAKFDSVSKEKMKGGYSPGAAGAAFVGSELEARLTGVTPMLLNSITEERAQELLDDPEWCLQEKYDGHRRLLLRQGDQQEGGNRKGLSVPLTEAIDHAMTVVAQGKDLELDGEQVGEVVWVFDVLRLDGVDMRNCPFVERAAALQLVSARLQGLKPSPLLVAETARSSAEKRAMYQLLRAEAEGGVFKRLSGPYVPGRPASGGDQLKRKFVSRDSFRVKKVHETKRSVLLEALDETGQWVEQGNCTIPANYSIPVTGGVVDVEYLYAFRGGSVFQPQYKGLRTDLDESACTMSVLRYKTREELDEDSED